MNPARRGALPARGSGAAVAALVVGLAVYNILRSTVVDGDLDIVANVAVGIIVFLYGRACGLTLGEIGLDRSKVGAGVRLGLAVGSVIALVVIAGAVVLSAGGDVDDDRVEVSLPAMLLRAFVVIPIATVVVEEVVFRGVLHGLLRRRDDTLRAAMIGSVVFGLWHLFPTWHDYDDPSGIWDLGRLGLLVGTFAFTFGAGTVFVWLRERSGHLIAPMLCHTASNSVTFAAGWLAAR